MSIPVGQEHDGEASVPYCKCYERDIGVRLCNFCRIFYSLCEIFLSSFVLCCETFSLPFVQELETVTVLPRSYSGFDAFSALRPECFTRHSFRPSSCRNILILYTVDTFFCSFFWPFPLSVHLYSHFLGHQPSS